MKLENKVYRAALYVRLSKEDGDKEESDSIINQRALIRNFLSDKSDIQVCGEFTDDGYTGANFDRPGFKKLLCEVEEGNIDCIIVKDLSRFGRNFVEAGRYIDQIFPSLGVRFIAVNDDFDSIRGRTSTDRILVPFKNLINDAFCRDISIKVRSQLEIKRKNGDFIGSFAVYGYLKDPADHHRLIVDDYAAAVVRDIFKWKLEGASQQRIADRLNERGELSPMEYKRFIGQNYKSGFQINPKSRWTAVTAGRILRNEFYIGTLVQGKRTTPNHKVKKVLLKPSDEWIRVENNHTPIIDCEDFYTVQRLLMQDTRIAPEKESVYILSGLVFCGDCGQNMVRSSVSRNEKTYVYYMCGNNRTNKLCTSHRISESVLMQAALLSLKEHIADILDMERILRYIETLPVQREEVQKADAQLMKRQEEIKRYDRLKISLYEALNDGLISKAEYLEMKAVYNAKIQEARTAESKLKAEMDDMLNNAASNSFWIERFKEHQNITELTRRIAVTLIERITVFEDCRLNIRFRYQYDYDRAVALIQNVQRLQAHAAEKAVM